jgi:hypothetical protein
VGLNPALASDDPFSLPQTPHLRTQYVVLESLLLDAGWSYQITTDANAFANEMATGQYVAYWLMAENISLSLTAQNNLMSAVSEGAGIVVSSGHDNLSTQFYSSLGVTVTGNHFSATELALLDSPVSNSSLLPLSDNEQVLKVSLSDAQSAAVFNGSGITDPENQAITWLDGTEGLAVFSAMDWLLQATAETGLSQFTKLIQQVIEFIHPLGLSNDLGYARAVQLNMQNMGRPVNGYVQVLLPPSVTLVHSAVPTTVNQAGFTFDYDLLANELLELEFWLQVDATPATLTFQIHLNDDVSVFDSLDLTLIAGERPDLNTALSNCQAGAKPNQSLKYSYQITNTGNKDIIAALAYTDFDEGLLNPAWTCTGHLGGVCSQNNGNGNLIGQSVHLPVGANVSFVFETQVMSQTTGVVMASGHVVMPDAVFDINPSDNHAIDVDAVYPFIFKNSFDCAAAGVLPGKLLVSSYVKEGQ